MRFKNYVQLREASKEPSFITSKIKLQKESGSKEFSPFLVNKSSRANLRPIIKAFLGSNQVGLGYTTIDKSKGEIEPQLKKKSLYLTGGAVRDHLKGKTPRNYDLVTDATVSEIRMILDQSEEGFTEIKPKSEKHSQASRYKDLPTSSRGKRFYVSRWDKKGKELEITIEINGEEFNIAPLSKASKSRLIEPDESEAASSIEDDAFNRDLTINSLYIPLSTPDGENSDLLDPYGGANHLKNGQIKFVGDKADERIQEDPMTALRLLKINARYGSTPTLPKDYERSVKSHIKDISKLPRDAFKSEFLSGLEHPDTDARKYLKSAYMSDILSIIFPNVEFDPQDLPENFKGDRWLSTAWVLRNNSPESIIELLSSNGWSEQEANDISYLVKLYQWASKDGFSPESFYDLKTAKTGLTKSKVRDWMKMVNLEKEEFNKFADFDTSELSPYKTDTYGKKSLNPIFNDFMGRTPVGKEFDYIKKDLFRNKWKDALDK